MRRTLLEGVWLSDIGRMAEVRNVPHLACSMAKLQQNIEDIQRHLLVEKQFITFASKLNQFENMAKLNRIKLALVEQGKTGRWLAEELGKSACTVSKWCSNTAQPDLKTLA